MDDKKQEAVHKPYISPSQIASYCRCGEAYRRRYIKKEIIPPKIAMVKGTAVHKGAEFNFKQKIDSHKDAPVNDIVDCSVNTLEETIKNEGLILSKEEEDIGKTKVINTAKSATATLAKLYTAKVAPRYQPRAVELDQVIVLENSSHNLKGRIDWIDDTDVIADLKTSGKVKSQADIDKDIQFTFYSMIFKAHEKREPRGLVVENLVDKKIPEVVTLKTERTMDDYTALINRINTVLDGINAGIYPPAHSGAWWCSSAFCGFWTSCPYIKK